MNGSRRTSGLRAVAGILLVCGLLGVGHAGAWTTTGADPARIEGGMLAFDDPEGDEAILRNVSAGATRFFDLVAPSPGGNATLLRHSASIEWVPRDDRAWSAMLFDAPTPYLVFRLGAGESVTFTLAEGLALGKAKPFRAVAANGDVAWFDVDGGIQQDDGRTVTFTAVESPARIGIYLVSGGSAWSVVARAFPPAFAARASLDGETAVLEWTEWAPAPWSGSAGFDAAAERLSITFPTPTDNAFRAAHLVVAPGVFGLVDRPEQIVVEVNDQFGVRLTDDELPEVEGGAGPFYTVSRLGDGWEFRFLVRSNGTTRINLTRDVAPPALIGEPRIENLTDGTLFLYTEMSDWSLVDIYLESRVPGAPHRDHNQLHRTTAPSIFQTFPVQGLRAERTYTYTVNATDVAGNVARFGPWAFTTLPAPVIPGPRVVSVFPERNATLPTSPVHLAVTLDVADSPLVTDRVRLFVDAREIDPERFVVNATGLVYIPEGGFRPGTHRAHVEVENGNGGKTSVTWSFQVGAPEVAGARGAPGPGLLLTAIAAVAAALLAMRPVGRNKV